VTDIYAVLEIKGGKDANPNLMGATADCTLQLTEEAVDEGHYERCMFEERDNRSCIGSKGKESFSVSGN